MRELTHLSLFSGIGGLDIAAEMAGFKTVGQCEWADYPTKILEKHWPDVPRWRDIRTLTKESFHERTGLHTGDIVSGGFPCQPFSVAGKQGGKDDDRYLWPEMLRVIRELRPSWVLGENVPGIVNLALDQVLSDLENEGYTGQAFIIPACGVDAPHKRDRVAILAYRIDRSADVCREPLSEDSEKDGRTRPDLPRRNAVPVSRERREDESSVSGVADGLRTEIHRTDSNTDCKLRERSSNEQVVFTECSCREREREREKRKGYHGRLDELVELTPLGKIGQMNPEWVEWLMGYPIGWTELNASETQ